MLRQEPEIERLDSRCWKVRGSCSLHDVSRALEYAFPEEEYETFSGFLIGSLGEIPKDGTKLKMQVGPFQVRCSAASFRLPLSLASRAGLP